MLGEEEGQNMAAITKEELIVALRKAIRDTLHDFAEEHGCSTEKAFYVLMGRQSIKTAGEKSEWGRLPEDYDPGTDESLNGLRP